MDSSDENERPLPGPAGDPAKVVDDERPAVVEVWKCTIREEWDDEPAFRVVVPPGTDTEEIGRFLVENDYVEAETIVPPYWLDDQPDDPDAEPGEDDLILERDSKGKLRVKED